MRKFIVWDKENKNNTQFDTNISQDQRIRHRIKDLKKIRCPGPTKLKIEVIDESSTKTYYVRPGQLNEILSYAGLKLNPPKPKSGLLFKANAILKEIRKEEQTKMILSKHIGSLEKKCAYVRENIPLIENIIGYTFTNKDLLLQAFIAKSSITKLVDNSSYMEYMGDRLLWGLAAAYASSKSLTISQGKVTADHLKLMAKISNITSNELFAKRIEELDLKKFSIHEGVYQTKIYANLFESIIGAIAIDSNYSWNILEDAYSKLAGLD